MYVDTLPLHHDVSPSETVATKLWAQNCLKLISVQEDSPFVHIADIIKAWFAKTGVEELKEPAQNPDLNSTKHLQDQVM